MVREVSRRRSASASTRSTWSSGQPRPQHAAHRRRVRRKAGAHAHDPPRRDAGDVDDLAAAGPRAREPGRPRHLAERLRLGRVQRADDEEAALERDTARRRARLRLRTRERGRRCPPRPGPRAAPGSTRDYGSSPPAAPTPSVSTCWRRRSASPRAAPTGASPTAARCWRRCSTPGSDAAPRR